MDSSSAIAPVEIRRLPQVEFTALLAMLFATVAFSIDSMLPALPAIGGELSPTDINRAQLILSAFVLGMGIGTFVVGPISDAIGRKPAITGGVFLYVVGAMMAYFSTSLEFLLFARVVQGIGAAAPRIVGLALSRDLYAGREMARVMSFVMMVFMIVPALAPMMGAGIIAIFGWRGIFLAFVLFGLLSLSWLLLRQEETLPPERRRALSARNLWAALKEVVSNGEVMLYTAVMTLGFGQMFALLSSIQQIFDQTYNRGTSFPYWFALIALVSASASFINSRYVVRLGMRRLATVAYLGQMILSLVMILLFASGLVSGTMAFAFFFIWANSIFFIAGLTFGNLNALAMQKMGHIAGMATSVISAISTVMAVVIAAPVGLAFDGTALPAMIGAAICSAICFGLMKRSERF